MSKVYAATSLIGGITGSLDNINGSGLLDKDIAIVGVQDGNLMPYILDADSAEAENSPLIIAPDNNAGSKRWKLVGVQPAFSHVQARRSSAGQSITSGSYNTIIWDTELKDSLGEYNNSTGIFTAIYAGTYILSAAYRFESVAWSADKLAFARVEKNGSLILSGPRTAVEVAATLPVHASVSGSVELAIGDTLEVVSEHNYGSSLTIGSSDTSYNYLTIDRIA